MGRVVSGAGEASSGLSISGMDQLTQDANDLNLEPPQDGNWVTVTIKNKNKAGNRSPKIGGRQHVAFNVWEQPNRGQRLRMGSNIGSGKAANCVWDNKTAECWRPAGREARPLPASIIATANSSPAPLDHGWNWVARSGSTSMKDTADPIDFTSKQDNEAEDDDEPYDDDDDELLSDEDFDSDASQKSHDSRKKHRMLRSFFEDLDKLKLEEMSEPSRSWHCPACQGGPGAIDWYKGLQPLMMHAKTKGSNRVKLHREFAQLLGEELRIRGTHVTPSGESFGQWEGLRQEAKDHEIVWPPMVMIRNTTLYKDDIDKWVGMGNQELLKYFSSYTPTKAQHSYGPQGHRGISMLIFEGSVLGYSKAERLHKHFLEQGTGRIAWDSRHVPLLYQGGKRQLFGYMATKEDLDIFNYHCHGKSRLKFDLRSYQEMVVSQMRQMSEDNQELTRLKDKVAKQKIQAQALEASNTKMRESIRNLNTANRIVRQRSKMQHDEDKEQMDYMEKFYKNLMQEKYEALDLKEDYFEKIQQDERKKMEELNASSADDYQLRADKLARLIKVQDQMMGKFVDERDLFIKRHEEEKLAMKKRHFDEQLELEKAFNIKLTKLMEKYTPNHFEDVSCGS